MNSFKYIYMKKALHVMNSIYQGKNIILGKNCYIYKKFKVFTKINQSICNNHPNELFQMLKIHLKKCLKEFTTKLLKLTKYK